MNKSSKFFLLFTVIYLFLEITFNIGLVDFINSKNTEINTFNKLEILGRILSSVGLSLFILNFLKFKKIILKALSFILLVITIYTSQYIIFDKIVDGLSNQSKMEAYSFGVYRNIYLNDQNNLSFKLFSANDKNYNIVLNSMIGALLYNENIKIKVNDNIHDFFAIKININPQDLSNVYDKTKNFYNNTFFDNMWENYYIESKKYNNYTGLFKEHYHEKFVETIGIEPNKSKEDFINYLISKNPNLNKINDLTIIPGNKNIGIKSLLLKDIPKGLNKQEWISFVQNYINQQIKQVSYNEININNFPHLKDIVSSVIIVPIAIILSLLSIILNIGVILSYINKKIALSWFVFILISSGFLLNINNYYNISKIENLFINLEKNYISILFPYKNIIHHLFVNDEKPNKNNIVVINKPIVPNYDNSYKNIETKFNNLKEISSSFNTQEDSNTIIDKDKLMDKGYYGEINKKNPYM